MCSATNTFDGQNLKCISLIQKTVCLFTFILPTHLNVKIYLLKLIKVSTKQRFQRSKLSELLIGLTVGPGEVMTSTDHCPNPCGQEYIIDFLDRCQFTKGSISVTLKYSKLQETTVEYNTVKSSLTLAVEAKKLKLNKYFHQ